MRAIEFQSKISNNAIAIPNKMLVELQGDENRNVRVVVFMEDSDVYDRKAFRKLTKTQFLKGYADSDSVYDE
ncbi:MAG: hypothetical protein FWC39_11785 [Bacteroidetes bacterium]|nr:hypothetical protein [Bacteroidota bacterium]